MCGIFCLVENKILTQTEVETLVNRVYKLLLHRGPDSQNYHVIYQNNYTILLIHTRLHIVGDSSKQPLTDPEETIHLIINGEIFNWKELSNELDYDCTKSDCEIIIPLYKKYKDDLNTFFQKLNGQFSFVLYDSTNNKIFIGRDHIGITPLYYGYSTNLDRFIFSSEMKAINTLSEKSGFISSVKVFYPRRYIIDTIENLDNCAGGNNLYTYIDYYKYQSISPSFTTPLETIHKNINIKLTNSVQMQLQDLSVNFGVLLSGGLDSSLITSIVADILSKKTSLDGKVPFVLKTFSIGMHKNSSDLVAARKVVKFLNKKYNGKLLIKHHEYFFTAQEGIDAIRDVIWYTETYDTTTIRAGTAMYLLTKKIKENFPDLKVLFSGELSDELLCYLYGSNAPNFNEFQMETLNLVSNVHKFDCLRANKTCMANSIEVRVPFTDPNFVEYILSLSPKYKAFGRLNPKNMEKQILRDSFVDYLPNEILYRKKEQFSDGVSTFNEDVVNDNDNDSDSDDEESPYIRHFRMVSNQNVDPINKITNWIDALKVYTDKKYNNTMFSILCEKYCFNKPKTKEQLYFREIFCSLFNTGIYSNTSELTVKFWKPRWTNTDDPSARAYSSEHFN
jgi:asparagine synthase (glutamine-hydrolysing)